MRVKSEPGEHEDGWGEWQLTLLLVAVVALLLACGGCLPFCGDAEICEEPDQ